MNPYQVTVTVEAPPRGSQAQAYLRFAAAQCVCTWSWGLQPATALIEWVARAAQPEILPLAQLTITISERPSGRVLQTFYGLAKSVVPVAGAEGRATLQEFVDTREFLQYDVVYGCFNKRESRIVEGYWVRRYWHILPADYNTQTRTYTDGPLLAREILNHLFSAPTCESPWVRAYHPALNFPVYDVDCLSGKPLGTVVTEISQALGTTFTLMGGRYRLVWTMKGAGDPPSFPANADNRRGGRALSGHPTRVRLLGERNLYQVLNLALEPDWLAAWEEFYDVDRLAEDLLRHGVTEAPLAGIAAGTPYWSIPGDAGRLQGAALAAARARTITVGQYAQWRDQLAGDGEAFRDYRRFGGRARLQMPAALYIQHLLWRAYRPPASFRLRGASGAWLDLGSLELVDRALVEVTHDPVSGEMFWERDVISAGNGYAIAQGTAVGQDLYKTLRPEHFQMDQWVARQALWQHLSFQIDDSGMGTKFILLDQPVFQTADLITTCTFSDGAGGPERYPVLNGQPSLTPAPVRASLIFAGEPFSFIAGEGTRDEVQNTSGLNGEFVAFADGTVAEELPYADGYTASEKAGGIAASLLNRQFVHDLGGYLVQGINGTQLSPVIDRVTVRWSENGATEEVDFTTERDRMVTRAATLSGKTAWVLNTPPERDFDRRAQLLNLLPGQRELKEMARQLQLDAAVLRQSPRLSRTVLEAYTLAFGLDGLPQPAMIDPGATPAPAGRLAVGTPLFKEAGTNLALSPQGAGGALQATAPVFVGVSVYHQVCADLPVPVTASGDNGLIYARVKGPVALNDPVGLGASVQSYLEAAPTLAVGSALAPIATAVVALIPVRVTGGGAKGDPVWL